LLKNTYTNNDCKYNLKHLLKVSPVLSGIAN
jgi:hypothetical protein